MTPRSGASSPDAARPPTLTGLRFLAAGSVFLFHIVYTGLFASDSAHKTYATIFGQAGFSGVSFFFVLSGFVLTVAARPESPFAFWRRRALKIYPNHVVTFVVAAVLLISVGQAIATGPAVTNLLLVQAGCRPGRARRGGGVTPRPPATPGPAVEAI